MFPLNEQPDIAGFVPAGAAPQTFPEQIAAAWQGQRDIHNFNAESHVRDRVWRERLDEVERVTGVRIPHPDAFTVQRAARDIPALFLGASDEEDGVDAFVRNAREVERRIEELRASNPGHAEAIRPGEWWEEEMRRRAAETFEDEQQAGLIPSLIGGVGASFTDPANVATLPFGFGRTILGRAASEAGINALVEGGSLPVSSRWRQELGLPEVSAEEAAMRVTVGAAFGGAIGGGGRALELYGPRATAAAREAFGRLPLRRQAEALRDLTPEDDVEAHGLADLLDREADIEDANPFGDGIEAEARHGELFAWAAQAARGDVLNESNPYRAMEVPPADRAQGAGMEAEGADFDPDGAGIDVQIERLRADQQALAADPARAADEFPTGLMVRDVLGEEAAPELTTRADIEAELAADTAAVERLRACAS